MNPRFPFPCPACGVILTASDEAAGERGNCPHCGSSIVGPDLRHGLPARLLQRASDSPAKTPPVAAVEPAPAAPPPIANLLAALQEPPAKPGPIFPDIAPVAAWPPPRPQVTEELPIPPPTPVAKTPAPAPATHQQPAPPPAPVACPATSSLAPALQHDPVVELRRYFFLFLLFAFPLMVLLSFFAGLWAGRGTTPTIMVNLPASPSVVTPQPPHQTPPTPPPPVSYPKPDQTPVAPTKMAEEMKPVAPASDSPTAKPVTPPAPEETSAPTQPSPVNPEPPSKPDVAQAEKTLREFLAAANVEDRASHALGGEAVLARMREYHRTWPDHPTAAGVVKLEHEETDEDTKKAMAIFQITTEALPDGFPVMLMDTDSGWKVDWDVFTEFHDNRFEHFAKGEAGKTGRFHLVVRNTHYFGERFDGLDGLTAYRLDPPMPDREQYAFAPTGSEVQKKLSEQTGWGRPFTPVLELEKHTSPNGVTWIEIKNLIATDWRPKL